MGMIWKIKNEKTKGKLVGGCCALLVLLLLLLLLLVIARLCHCLLKALLLQGGEKKKRVRRVGGKQRVRHLTPARGGVAAGSPDNGGRGEAR